MGEVILHNNNYKVIRKLSRRYLKASRGRNFIAILAIALTTMMFTSIFTIGNGFIDVQQQQTMRQSGGSAHGAFKYITWEECNQLKDHPSIQEYGLTIYAANGENLSLSKVRSEIRWADENYAKWTFSMPTTGTLPQNGKELAASTIVLDALQIPHKLGETVPLEFTIHGKKYQDNFTLTGFWDGDPALEAHAIYLSKDYIEQVAPVSTLTKNDREDQSPACTLSLNVMFQNSSNLENKLNKILTDTGYSTDQIDIGYNWAYLSSGEMDPATLLIILVSLLLIGGAGYLIIYNVFYISVTRDIRNYGLLKTLGTTPRQLRRLVRRQALLLSLLGIPIGILIGYGMGYLLLPALMAITSYSDVQIPLTLNPIVPLGAAVFALATVWISCRKPCKIAAVVSPIEALRTHEADSGKRKSRKSGHISTLRLSWHNVIRSKKRVIAVVLSLTLSIVLLNGVYGAIRSFDIDKYMARNILTDFSIADGTMLTRFDLAYLDPTIMEDLGTLPGVTTASPVYMQEYRLPPDPRFNQAVKEFVSMLTDVTSQIKDTLEPDTQTNGLPAHLYGIDQFLYEKLEFTGDKPSWETFCSGNYILASAMVDEDAKVSVYSAGDTIALNDKEGKPQDYTVLTTAKIPRASTPLHGHITDIDLILPMDSYLTSFSQENLMYLHLEADKAAVPALEKSISNYCASRTTDYHSRASYLAEFKELQSTYLLVGGALGGILGLVGILNFINSITTSILTRRRELAMLQSVGMTTKQLRQMLIQEGLWYLILTALLTLTIGNLFSAFLVKTIAGAMWFFTFHFSMMPMAVCLLLLMVPSFLIPWISYRSVNKQSVVERLGEE